VFWVGTIDHLLQDYGSFVVFGVVMLEAMGVPLPGESMIIAASLYAATTGRLSIGMVIAAAAAGAILGDNAGYLIGRWAGFPLLERFGRHVGLTERRLMLGRYLFKIHGGKVVFVGRFVAILRTFVALMAGASHMDWKVFLLWNAVGGVAWTLLYGTGAYLLGDAMRRVEGPLGIGLGAVGVVVIGASIWFLRRNEKRLEDKAAREMQERTAI
jgi:membrane protein DedA with SNARE-associated domain